MGKPVALLVLAAAIFFGYEWKLHRPMTAPMIPMGKTYQSPSFFTLADRTFNLDMGIQSVPTTEAACLAVRPKIFLGKPQIYPANQPCRTLDPPMGAIDWVVKKTSSGEVVKSGICAGHGWDWPGPSELSRDWYRMGWFKAELGGRYVIVLTLHDPQLPLDRYRPLLRVDWPPPWP